MEVLLERSQNGGPAQRESRPKKLLRFWKKHPALWVVLAAELAVAALFAAAALRAPAQYAFAPDQLQDISQGAQLAYDENGYRGVVEFATEGQPILQTPPMSLPAGHYRVTLDYHAEGTRIKGGKLHHSNLFFSADEPLAVEGELAVLDNDTTQQTAVLSVSKASDTVRLHFYDDGGVFTVGTVQVEQDMGYAAVKALGWVLLCLGINLLVLLFCADSPWCLTRAAKRNFLILCGITLLASLPMLQAGLGSQGDDWVFHLERIEGITQALREGQFPVRLYSMAKSGYGYAPSLFYGELFLYFPALLRLLGVSIQAAYKSYVIAVTALTAALSFYSFLKMFRKNQLALLGSFFYTFSYYRIFNVYGRMAVGEYTAAAFLPLLAYGLWLIYAPQAEPADAADLKERNRAWWVLAISFSALLQCHMITLELAALAALVVGLLFFRTTFRAKTLLTWLKAFAATILCNLWFLYPFLSTMATGLYGTITSQDIQGMGLDLTELAGFSSRGSVGISMIAVALIFLFYCATDHLPRTERRAGKVSLLLGGVACLLSTDLFPWNDVVKIPVLGKVLQVIQFPWRYLSVASIALAVVLLCLVAGLAKVGKKPAAYSTAALCAGLCLLSVILYYQGYLPGVHSEYIGNTSQLMYVDEKSNLAYKFDNLYIPQTATETMDGYTLAEPSYAVVEAVSRQNGVLSVTCAADQGQAGSIELPLLYFPGYRVLNADAAVFLTEHGMVGVRIPAGYSGTLQIKFCEPKRWLAADLVSLAALLALGAGALHKKRRAAKTELPTA